MLSFLRKSIIRVEKGCNTQFTRNGFTLNAFALMNKLSEFDVLIIEF